MKCPGQDSRYWKPGAIFEAKCPECGADVEFFKDDSSRRCKSCGFKFLNPSMDFGCASYCKYAEQCIGNLSPELLAQKEDMLKDRAAIEMKRYFKQDFKRIGHADRVARYAEEIGKEEGGDMSIILTAAYLHDIGIKDAQEKHRSSDARYQGEEVPRVAREILNGIGARDELIDEVCDIIGHHHPRPDETMNFKVVYDADLIANMEEKQKEGHSDTLKTDEIIREGFLTESGRRLAKEILLR
ncbi:MAG TPA: HD domain-containing protein [Desulfatiglandales bacterium]|nr:HD domain-containing protein [Desulfatiglandales bacterium]